VSIIVPLELTGLTKVFPTDAGPFVAVKNVNVKIHKSEFICIVGHSGCGKSTVLSIIAGLQRATEGGVVINGRQTIEPGEDRAVVFQTPSLLPWLTARQNVELAVRQKFRTLKAPERRAHALKYLALTSVADAADQLPGELSLGMQQCVSLARALALEPQLLLLDEPFSMLDFAAVRATARTAQRARTPRLQAPSQIDHRLSGESRQTVGGILTLRKETSLLGRSSTVSSSASVSHPHLG
jgi:nitrate/nitrite transport system ATP-binding protein